jgi:hypothetical protein
MTIGIATLILGLAISGTACYIIPKSDAPLFWVVLGVIGLPFIWMGIGLIAAFANLL